MWHIIIKLSSNTSKVFGSDTQMSRGSADTNRYSVNLCFFLNGRHFETDKVGSAFTKMLVCLRASHSV